MVRDGFVWKKSRLIHGGSWERRYMRTERHMLRLALALLLVGPSAAFLAPSAPLARLAVRASAGGDSPRSSRPPARASCSPGR